MSGVLPLRDSCWSNLEAAARETKIADCVDRPSISILYYASSRLRTKFNGNTHVPQREN